MRYGKGKGKGEADADAGKGRSQGPKQRQRCILLSHWIRLEDNAGVAYFDSSSQMAGCSFLLHLENSMSN